MFFCVLHTHTHTHTHTHRGLWLQYTQTGTCLRVRPLSTAAAWPLNNTPVSLYRQIIVSEVVPLVVQCVLQVFSLVHIFIYTNLTYYNDNIVVVEYIFLYFILYYFYFLSFLL